MIANDLNSEYRSKSSAPRVGWPSGRKHSQEARDKMGATRLGMNLADYQAKREAGLRWCFAHQEWHPIERFGPHKRRADGLDSQCREANREYSLEYQRQKRDREYRLKQQRQSA